MTHGTPLPGQPVEPDEIDRLFSAYFQHQIPKHWPAFDPGPSAQPVGPRASGNSGRSRATLAVSVAALLGLGLYLSSGPLPSPSGNVSPSGPALLPNATAKGPDLSKRLHDTPEAEKGTRSP
jgi:hypothetical protein